MKHTVDVELRRMEKALSEKFTINANFSSSKKSPVKLSVKLKMAALILNLRQREIHRRKKFGLLVILGWKKQWQKYADTPDAKQDLFAKRAVNIMQVGNQNTRESGGGRSGKHTRNQRRSNIVRTINFDGAILIDPRGNILHSGTMIEGLRPRATAHKINPRNDNAPDLSAQFGFKRKVHMRHITAITSSYLFKGTTVFTISEETNDFHIFENGKIIYSTVKGESTK